MSEDGGMSAGQIRWASCFCCRQSSSVILLCWAARVAQEAASDVFGWRPPGLAAVVAALSLFAALPARAAGVSPARTRRIEVAAVNEADLPSRCPPRDGNELDIRIERTDHMTTCTAPLTSAGSAEITDRALEGVTGGGPLDTIAAVIVIVETAVKVVPKIVKALGDANGSLADRGYPGNDNLEGS
jgi:hypothetical protein